MDEKRNDNMREQEGKSVTDPEDKDVFKYRNTQRKGSYAQGDYEPVGKKAREVKKNDSSKKDESERGERENYSDPNYKSNNYRGPVYNSGGGGGLPPKRKNHGILILSLVIVVFLIIGLGAGAFFSVTPEDDMQGVSGVPFFGEYIAVVNVNGVISESSGGFLNDNAYDHKFTLNTIKNLEKEKRNKGLIIKVDSPGGGVYASHQLYEAIRHYKENTGRPVYSVMGSIAASGGYYISAPCDKIYAVETTWTGSIGVTLGNFYDISGFLKKHGIKVTTLTSGRNKAMGDITRPITNEQKKIFMSLIKDSYDRFVKIVADGRNLPLKKVRKLADGRVYTATQAMNLKLIDKFGTVENAVEDMTLETGSSDIETVVLEPEPESFWDGLGLSAEKILQGRDPSNNLRNLLELAESNTFKITYMSNVTK